MGTLIKMSFKYGIIWLQVITKGHVPMSIDSMQAARLYRELRTQSLQKQSHQAHIPHQVMPNETLDPSLSNRFVYGNRADWYVSAAINGQFDVDIPVQTGLRRYLSLQQINATAHKKQKTGMNLYE